MRSCAVILLGSALVACGSSSNFCDQFSPVLQAQEDSITSCRNGDAGGDVSAALSKLSGEFPFSIQACPTQLNACNAADLAQLNDELKCVKVLPVFQCAWLDDENDAGIDGGLEDYQARLSECEPTNISAACQGSNNGLGCGVETHSANNISTQPLELGQGTTQPIVDCMGIGDTHYLSITAPSKSDSPAGGYFEITISGITANVSGQLVVSLADANNNQLNNANYKIDSTSGIFLAVAPASTFLIEVTSDSGNVPLGYSIAVSFVPINDPYKPDPAISFAQHLDLGMATSGSYVWAGQRTALALSPSMNGDFDDWFKVDMPNPGSATISLQGFPVDFAPEVDFADGSGTQILPRNGAKDNTPQFGGLVFYTATVPSTGTYYVHVFPYQFNHQTYTNYSLLPLQATPVLPSHFTTTYNLTVTYADH